MYTKRAPRKQTLNVLLCGTSGTGKSSFTNTLVGKRVLYESESMPAPEYATTLAFQPTTVEMDEPLSDGSRLVLTVVETQGFGTAFDHREDIDQVAMYIENKFDEVLAEESRIRRNPRFKDNRIDVCLYFIEPTGHGLREVDFLTLKRLSNIVNVIPVLSRADQLTPAERNLNKRLVNEDLRFAEIDVFDFQFSDDFGEVPGRANSSATDGYVDESFELQEADTELAMTLQEAIPFAISSANQFDEHDECLYIRKLSFGAVEIMNPKHTDVELVKNALFNSFFTELKDRTHEVLYETYRTNRLDPQQAHSTSMMLPTELADHAANLKKAQIEREQRMLQERELRVIAEIEAKRAMLIKREQQLRELEQKMAEQQLLQQQRQLQQQFANREEQLEEHYGTHFNAVAQQQPPQQQPQQPPLQPQQPYTTNPYQQPVSTQQYEATRVKQSESKRELTQHTQQLHAELGHLEQEKQDLQNRRMSVHGSTSPLHINKGG